MTPWLFVAVIVGTILARVLLELAGWLWRRNHPDVEDIAGERHRELEGWLADQNDRIDTLLASLAEQGGKHGVTGPTGFMPPAELSPAELTDLHARFHARSQQAAATGRTTVLRDAAPVTVEPPAASDAYTGIVGWPT